VHTLIFSSPSIGTTAHWGLWSVEQYPSIFLYLSPTPSNSSRPALEDLFPLPRFILSWVFPFVSSFPVLGLKSLWALYPPAFSPGYLTTLSFALYPFYYIFSLAHLYYFSIHPTFPFTVLPFRNIYSSKYFFSKSRRTCSSLFFIIHASAPYDSTVLISGFYNNILVAQDKIYS